MLYQEEGRLRLKRQTTKQAIALAMQARWQEAVVANESLIENFPNDVDAYNRLGRAYMELGEYPQAKKAYEKAMTLDPYNTVAKKNLDRLSHLEGQVVSSASDLHKVEPRQFIEEVGKAGVVRLFRLAPPETLARMVAGSRVSLRVEGANLVVETSRGEYLGQVEPKHGRRLVKLMEGGNKYVATIVSSTEGLVTVIIREVYQDPSQAGYLSFPPKGGEGFRSYVADRMVRRELEYEETRSEELGYSEVEGEEAELLLEETGDIDEGETEE